MSESSKFDQWAIVELMGHQKIAGHVMEQPIGGAGFIRVDVPAVKRRKHYGSDEMVDVQAYTRYLAPAAVYAINPCSEAVARASAATMHVAAPSLLEFQPQAALPASECLCLDSDDVAHPGCPIHGSNVM